MDGLGRFSTALHFYLGEEKVKLETKGFYNTGNLDWYEKTQRDRCLSKITKIPDIRTYDTVAKHVLPFFEGREQGIIGICLGSRNNHERQMLRITMHNENIYSLDIEPQSCADYVMNFSKLPEEWENKFDFIYSNSIDHAPFPTETYTEWFRILKPKGILLVGFDLWEGIEGEPIATDCSLFTKESIDEFFENEKYDVLFRFKQGTTYSIGVMKHGT